MFFYYIYSISLQCFRNIAELSDPADYFYTNAINLYCSHEYWYIAHKNSVQGQIVANVVFSASNTTMRKSA